MSADTDKMDALIVKNLRDLDMASKRLWFDVQSRIAEIIDSIVESWAKTHGWKGEFDWEGKNLWLGPREWVVDQTKDDWAEDDNWFGWFALDAGHGDHREPFSQGHDVFWLTRLCNAGQGMICFRWHRGDLGANKSKWKKFVQSQIDSIQKAGLKYEDDTGLFFCRVIVDPATLATAIEEDQIEEALQPFIDALDVLLAAKPAFDIILKDARREFRV